MVEGSSVCTQVEPFAQLATVALGVQPLPLAAGPGTSMVGRTLSLCVVCVTERQRGLDEGGVGQRLGKVAEVGLSGWVHFFAI